MSARLSICVGVALLIGTGSATSSVQAKPPGLPVNLKVDCQIETDLRPPESASFDGELDANAAIAQPEDVVVMPTKIEVLSVMPKAEAAEDADDLDLKRFVEGLIGTAAEGISRGTVQPGGRSQPDYTCPYLKQKAAEAEAPARESPGLVNSVLDNLNKLLEAEKLYRRAERCRRHGETDKACHWYEVVQHLCPGSRFDRLAAKRLKELHAVQDAEAAEMEAEESSATFIPIEAQVAELLEACQRALADGRYGEARDLAVRAQALDPACVAAKALVIKAHALSHRHQTTETGDEEEASSCDGAEGPQPQATAGPSPVELEIELLFRPADPEKCAECEDDACPGVGTHSMRCDCCADAGKQMLRQVCEALRHGNALDVDISATGRVRVRYSSPLGNIECCFGGDLPGSVVVKSAWLRLLDVGAEMRSCKSPQDAGQEEAIDRAGFEPVED